MGMMDAWNPNAPDNAKAPKFKVGDWVKKPKGYEFPGTVVSVFQTTNHQTRYVVEMIEYGLLHIFNEDQLAKVGH